jgi:hypothetical protein
MRWRRLSQRSNVIVKRHCERQNRTYSNVTYFASPTMLSAILARLADSNSTGLAYWTNQLQSNAGNAQAVASFILNVTSGAGGADQLTIANKVTVADYFTANFAVAGLNFTSAADALAHSAIASVTSALSTLLAAEATINTFLAAPSSSAEVALSGHIGRGAERALGRKTCTHEVE